MVQRISNVITINVEICGFNISIMKVLQKKKNIYLESNMIAYYLLKLEGPCNLEVFGSHTFFPRDLKLLLLVY